MNRPWPYETAATLAQEQELYRSGRRNGTAELDQLARGASQLLDNASQVLTTKEAARLLGVKPQTLELWRHKGTGPAYLKLSRGLRGAVRYEIAALRAWAAERTFVNTSAYSSTAKPRV